MTSRELAEKLERMVTTAFVASFMQTAEEQRKAREELLQRMVIEIDALTVEAKVGLLSEGGIR